MIAGRLRRGAVALAIVSLAVGCAGTDEDGADGGVTDAAEGADAGPATSTTVGGTDGTAAPTTTAAPSESTTTVPGTTGTTAAAPTVVDDRLVGEAADGTALWDVVYAQLRGTAVDDAVNEVLAAGAEELLASWRRDIEGWETFDDLPSDLFVRYDVTLLDDRHLSILVSGSSYFSGAAHPTGIVRAHTFDLDTGRERTLEELFDPATAWSALLAEEARTQLQEQFGDLVEIETLELSEATDFSVFNLTPTGLLVTFGDGQIGPHALGMPSIEIPYERLAGIAAQDGPLAR